jgi:hypothetical protein
MSRRLVRAMPAALAPVALLWVVASEGVAPSPAAVLVTVIVVAGLAVAALRRGVPMTAPTTLLAGLVVWTAAAGVLRPVDPGAAAYPVATAAVSLALALLVTGPRAAAWGRLGVVLGGAAAASWLVTDRLAGGGRPAGPFENPNLAATIVVVALSLVPPLRAGVVIRLGTGALLVAGTLASASRAAMLAAVAVGVLWATVSARRSARVAVMVLATCAAVGLAWRLATDRDPLRFDRLRIWGVAVRTAVAELPFGSGPSGYADAALPQNFPREGELARYYRLPTLAESDALQLAATLGVTGFLLGAGLVASVLAAARWRVRTLAPCLAVAVTSALHTQLPVPVVAWTATLAVLGSLPRSRARRLRLPSGAAAAGACAGAAAAALALGVMPGQPVTALRCASAAAALRAAAPASSGALADAEAQASHACALRPRWASAWSLLGALRLERALASGDAALAVAAADAFAAGRRANPIDIWLALGEGRARRVLGDTAGAARALETAVRLEPNCAPAWLELALLRLDGGEIAAATAALAKIDGALSSSRGKVPVSDYERAMVTVDRVSLVRLRVRCGVSR